MRILILGDSLAAPRPAKGQPLEKTWPGLLKEAFPTADVWQRARPRSCSIDVLAEFKLFTESLARFDTLVVQTGIVDCVPRPYPRWCIKVFEIFASFEQLRDFDRAAHRHFLWAYGRAWVSPAAFRENLGRLIREAAQLHPTLQILLTPIAPPTRRMLTEFRGIAPITARYNEVMRTLAGEYRATTIALDPFAGHDPLELTLDDGHHLTTLGHELIAAGIASALCARRPPRAASAA